MGLSYDAQRNEFCAYVLHGIARHPYGLLLGNFKTYAQSTAKGGVRGLWDADTDQIIFGTHHIAYRLGRRARSSRIRSSAISRFCLTRRSPSLRSIIACTSPKLSTCRTATEFDRAVAFVVDITLYNPGAQKARSGDLSVGDARRPALLRRARASGARVERRALHLLEEPRDRRRALVGRLARSGRGRTLAARAGAARIHAPRDADKAKAVDSSTTSRRPSRSREPAHLRRVGIPDRGGRRARASRCAWPSSIIKTEPERSRAGARSAACGDRRALHDTQGYFTRASRRRAILSRRRPEISRGVAWAKANMLRIVKEYPHGWGADQLAALRIFWSRATRRGSFTASTTFGRSSAATRSNSSTPPSKRAA